MTRLHKDFLLEVNEDSVRSARVNFALAAAISVGVPATLAAVGGELPDMPIVTEERYTKDTEENKLIPVIKTVPTNRARQVNFIDGRAAKELILSRGEKQISDPRNSTEIALAISDFIRRDVPNFPGDRIYQAYILEPGNVTVSSLDSKNAYRPSEGDTTNGDLVSYELKFENTIDEPSIRALLKVLPEMKGIPEVIFPQHSGLGLLSQRYTVDQYTRIQEVLVKHGYADMVTLNAALNSDTSVDLQLKADVNEAILGGLNSFNSGPMVIIEAIEYTPFATSAPFSTKEGEFGMIGMVIDSYCEVQGDTVSANYQPVTKENYINPLFGGGLTALIAVAAATRIVQERRRVGNALVPTQSVQEAVANNTATTAEKLEVLRYKQEKARISPNELVRRPRSIARFTRAVVGLMTAVTGAHGLAAYTYFDSEQVTRGTVRAERIGDFCDADIPVMLISSEMKSAPSEDVYVPTELIDDIKESLFSGTIDGK